MPHVDRRQGRAREQSGRGSAEHAGRPPSPGLAGIDPPHVTSAASASLLVGRPAMTRPPPRGSRLDTPWAWGSAGMLTFLLLWEALPRLGIVDAEHLPPLSRVLHTLGQEATTAEFWSQLGSTLTGWALGLAIASVLGIVLGIVIGSVQLLRAMTHSTIEFLRPVPSVALIPLVVILFGTGMESTLFLVVYAAFWQMLIQVMYGVHDVDPVARETARSYRFSTLRQVRTVTWPTALPFVMTGFRLAAAVALILEVTGELIIGSPGIGKGIALAQSAGASEKMYALVIVAGVVGVLVNLTARAVERRALRWHPSVRGESST